jgi:hypothetical protein
MSRPTERPSLQAGLSVHKAMNSWDFPEEQPSVLHAPTLIVLTLTQPSNKLPSISAATSDLLNSPNCRIEALPRSWEIAPRSRDS